MNFSHLHLIMNHIPVVGLPIALLFLAYGLYQRNLPMQRFSLFVLLGLAAMVIPVYLTGEPAEKLIEHLPGVAESFIETHEDAAMVSLILTLLTGLASLIALLIKKDDKKNRFASFVVAGLAFIAVLSLMYTANMGGKVRHTELRADSEAAAPSSQLENVDK